MSLDARLRSVSSKCDKPRFFGRGVGIETLWRTRRAGRSGRATVRRGPRAAMTAMEVSQDRDALWTTRIKLRREGADAIRRAGKGEDGFRGRGSIDTSLPRVCHEVPAFMCDPGPFVHNLYELRRANRQSASVQHPRRTRQSSNRACRQSRDSDRWKGRDGRQGLA